MKAMMRLSYAMWVLALLVVVMRPFGFASGAVAWTMTLAGFFRRGVERGQMDRVPWFAGIPAVAERSIPLGIAIVGGGWLWWGRIHGAWSPAGMSLLIGAIAAAGWSLGHRAGRKRFGIRQYRDDVVFGSIGFLIGGVIAAAALPISRPTGMTPLLAAVVLVTCAAIAMREEPMYVTRWRILAQAFERRRIARLRAAKVKP